MPENSNLLTIDSLFENHSSVISRDLKLNLKKLLEESSLTPAEANLALLATATTVEHAKLVSLAKEKLRSLDVSREQIQEAAESAAIMGMLNMYYRFKHFISHGEHGNKTDYQTAGLRMTSLAKPLLGKEPFEMLAFAVSVINGCEACVNAHEQALKHASIGVDKIQDLARLASVVKGLKALDFTTHNL